MEMLAELPSGNNSLNISVVCFCSNQLYHRAFVIHCYFLVGMTNFMSPYINISSLVLGVAGVALCWLLLQNRKKVQISIKVQCWQN